MPELISRSFCCDFAERLLLHDGFHAITGAGANHATIAKRIGRRGGKNRHGSFFAEMEIAQTSNGLRSDQRHVAGEHKNILVRSHLFASAHNGVSGAALFSLQDKLHAHGRNGSTHIFRLMADDDIDVLGGNDLLRGLDYVRQQRLAAYFMQHLGAAGLEPSAFACCHDYDGKLMVAVDFLVTHQAIILKPAAPVREPAGGICQPHQFLA